MAKNEIIEPIKTDPEMIIENPQLVVRSKTSGTEFQTTYRGWIGMQSLPDIRKDIELVGRLDELEASRKEGKALAEKKAARVAAEAAAKTVEKVEDVPLVKEVKTTLPVENTSTASSTVTPTSTASTQATSSSTYIQNKNVDTSTKK